MNEEEQEFLNYDGFHIEEPVVIEIVPEEINLDESLVEQHNRHAYMQVNERCPNPSCMKYTLEYQIFGNEKEIFCTSCDFHNTIQI